MTTRERWVDGELENSMVVDVTTTVEPTNHVVKTYGAGAPVSPLTGTDGTTNAPASYSRVLTGKATGYYSKSGKGSSGLGLGYGTVAVDPDVIPYGTLLYITSTDGRFVYGYAIATDTGIAVQKGEILVELSLWNPPPRTRNEQNICTRSLLHFAQRTGADVLFCFIFRQVYL